MAALEGVRVIDMTWSIAGPYCGQLLGDLGADVIRVEHPGRALVERVNLNPPAWDGEPFSPFFLANNRNKRSMTLNLKSPDGLAVLSDLVRVSDVVIENFSNAARTALVDETWAWAINPRIIWGSLTYLGRSGPGANEDGLDLLAQARSGIIDITGFPDGPPTKAGWSTTDYTAGTHLAMGVLAALYQRERIGRGQLVDISMLEAAVACLDGLPLWASVAGQVPTRVGNEHPARMPGYKVLECADGYVATAAVGPPFDRFVAEELHRAELVPLPMPGHPHDAHARDEVTVLFAEWARAHSCDEVHTRLKHYGIMCEPVRTIAETWSDPQLLARRAFVEFEYPGLGTVRTNASPLRLSESEAELRFAPAEAGAHNEQILGELLGYDDERIRQLHTNGALWGWE